MSGSRTAASLHTIALTVVMILLCAQCSAWVSVGDGIEYQSFTTPDPNNVFVCRMTRSNLNTTIESSMAKGKLARSSSDLATIPTQAAFHDDSISWWGQEWGARNDVVCAINGDFFGTVYAPNYIADLQIHSGWYAKRISEWGGHSGFGWTTNRLAFIGGCVHTTADRNYITVLADNIQLNFDNVNTARGANDIIIYTPQYDSNTTTDNTGIEWVVQMDRPTLILTNPYMAEGTVTSIRVNQGSTPIPWDCIVISATGSKATQVQSYLAVGKRIGVTQYFLEYEKDCNTPRPNYWTKTFAGVGGNYVFLKDGVIQPTTNSGLIIRNPRTAIAYNSDYVFFIVVDGRSTASVGMTMAELGQWCISNLQATDGTNQDGGGSSTMVVNGVVKNVPSDGSPRSVANGMLMVNVAPKLQSAAFSAGQSVTTNASTTVRLGPGTNYGTLTTKTTGSVGTIVAHSMNGLYAKGFCWWQVDFSGTVGWAQENLLLSGTVTPTILQHPQSVSACSGDSVKFQVAATGRGTIAYRWQKNSVNLSNGGHYSGVLTSKLLISNIDSSDLADYRCVVSTSSGNVTSNNATLSQGTQPAAPTAQPATNVGTDAITWNWSAVAGAQYYQMWTAASGGTQIGGVIDGNFYTETGLDPATSYTRYVESWGCGVSATRTQLGPTATLARNCPENGDLEGGFTNGLGNHWTKQADDGTSSFAQETSIVHGGASSQRINDPTGGQAYTGWVYQKLNVQANRNYLLSYWNWRASTNGFVTVIGCDPSGGTNFTVSGQTGSAHPGSTWLTRTIGPFTSGSGGVITIGFRGGANGGDTYGLVDDVVLRPAPPTSSSGGTTICSGQTATISASGGFGGVSTELHWYTGPNGTGAHAGTGTTRVVTPGTTTSYYPRWEAASSCGSCCISDDGPSVTVTVQNCQPTVTAVTPSVAPNTGTVSITDLSGTNFVSGASVHLRRTGYSNIFATGVAVESDTKITCLLDLTSKKTGLWDVVVTNPGAQFGALVNGFGIGISESADVVGSTISSLLHSIAVPASTNYRFCVWGVVETIDSSTFWLDDGSGARIKVFAPGYSGITNNGFASAIGTADVSSGTLVLVSSPAQVRGY